MSAKAKTREWVGGRLRFPAEIAAPEPIQPDIIFWLELPEDLVVASSIVDPTDPDISFGETLLAAMREPIAGPPRRPARIRVADAELAAEVRAAAPGIEVVVAPTPELDRIVELLANSLPGIGEPSYLDDGMVDAEVVEDLFAAARLLFVAAPWNTASNGQVLCMDIPQLGVQGACVSIIGDDGEALGVAIFPSLDAFEDFAETLETMADEAGEFLPPEDGEDVDFGSETLSLTFVDAAELPASENDVRVISACMLGLVGFLTKHGHLFEIESFDPVCESFFDEDDLEVRFTIPYEAADLFEANESPGPDTSAGDSLLFQAAGPSLPRRPKVGRNDPCPCGSGKKYKRCCIDRGGGDEARHAPGAAAGEGTVAAVMAWAGRDDDDADEWDERRLQVLGEHLGEACDSLDLHVDDMFDMLGEGLADSLLAWAMEDLLTRRFDVEDEMSMIEEYLERHAWRLNEPNARYLAALGGSAPGLYEVLHVRRGEGLVLMDLVMGGEPVEVVEHSASMQLTRWDRIACRVLDLGDRTVLAGALLHFRDDATDDVVDAVKRMVKKVSRKARKNPALKAAAGEAIDELIWDEVMATTAPLFSSIWLLSTIETLTRPKPELVNFDGEPVAMVKVRLPLDGDPDEASRMIDASPAFERNDEARRWSWVVTADEVATGSAPTMPGGGHPIRGTLELVQRGKKQPALVLETNSRERGERGKELLEELLGERTRPGFLEVEDIGQASERTAAGVGAPADSSIPPEVQAEVRRQFNDGHLRDWIDMEIPALGDKTPRRAVRSKAGRRGVLRLLKEIERAEHRVARDLGVEPYDVTWLWRELGLVEHRPTGA